MIPPHPLDLRTMCPESGPATATGSKTIEELLEGKAGVQQTDVLLQRKIGDRFRPDLPDYILVIDGLANGLAKDLLGPPSSEVSSRVDAVMAWHDGASTAERQRFAIAYAHNYLHQAKAHSINVINALLKADKTESAHESAAFVELAKWLRDRILGAADVAPTFPTIDRLYKHILDDYRLGPAQTAELRAAEWRDAAGRDIDTCLLMGAATARHAAPALASHVPPHDRELALRIDKALPSPPHTLEIMLRTNGLLLTPSHRQVLIGINQQPGDLGEELPQPALAPHSLLDAREYLLECLNLDRANSLFAVQQITRRATPAEPPCALTL